MASQCRRSPRAALVACAPSLARIHERIAAALGIADTAELRGSYGQPGAGCLRSSCHTRGELDEALSEGPTDRYYDLIRAFAIPYLSEEWLSKLDDGLSNKAKASAAWERFDLAEISCLNTNQRLATWRSSPFVDELSLARKLVAKVLGRFDWDQAASSFGFGPGATTRLTRRKADAAHKYSGNPHSTIGNAILANTVLQWSPAWSRTLDLLPESEGVGYVKIVPGNRVVTVPKNYKTDRVIAIEPDMNIYIQLGLGNYIRKRLARKAGVNLNDQTVNQGAAHFGSFSGGLATVDLSMASDTVSLSIVELLVSPQWLEALGQCRSPFGVLPSGKKVLYRKFSSMGNGYTFELESLIFWALAKAYYTLHGGGDERVYVYGDDLVVPSRRVDGFLDLLSYSGFTPNEKKTHISGPFRESCGKHYYHGTDITPFYVKRAPKTLLDLFKIHNQVWRYIDRCAVWLGRDRIEALQGVCSWLRGFAPARWRKPTLVDGIGDGGFVGYFDEVLPPRAKLGWDGYVFRSFVTTPVLDSSHDGSGLLVKVLKSLEKSGSQCPVQAALAGFEPSGASVGVYPTVGTRPREKRIFIPSSELRKLSTGLFYPLIR